MNTILVPVDFSGVSRAVVATAIRLARQTKGRIVLLHVIQPPMIATYDGVSFGDVAEYATWAGKNADQHLARLRLKLKKNGVAGASIREMGYPASCILAAAKKRAANYIVIGSHGHTAFYDLVIGSTTSGVLKRATCPVLVVPASIVGRAPRRGKQ